ncbi:uncharacterized protein LOC117319226 isoform X3 [Pecten maximus]|uniref:uncharacterized protein LOC117319226 isoform X3 n=1 Tax=Pecten maximus TaxID=6579 RepID=UPI00145882A5|nr:uncharacterized protein LOC117319226 isoform X3 [Pecten maximus]
MLSRRRENLPSQKQVSKTKPYARGISAFNAFVAEHKDTPVLSVEQENTKSLRKRAMEHLNSLFGSAVGRPHPFPYKRVFAGEVVVKGLPEEKLSLRFMSHYGEQKLKAVLACAKIEVSGCNLTSSFGRRGRGTHALVS